MIIKGDDLTDDNSIVMYKGKIYVFSGSYSSIIKGVEVDSIFGFFEDKDSVKSLNEISSETNVSYGTIHSKANELVKMGILNKEIVKRIPNKKHKYYFNGRIIKGFEKPYTSILYFLVIAWLGVGMSHLFRVLNKDVPLVFSSPFFELFLALFTLLTFAFWIQWNDLG